MSLTETITDGWGRCVVLPAVSRKARPDRHVKVARQMMAAKPVAVRRPVKRTHAAVVARRLDVQLSECPQCGKRSLAETPAPVGATFKEPNVVIAACEQHRAHT